MSTKRIRIPHNGPILVKGGMYGPIVNPYLERVEVIGRMVMSNIPVIEVLSEGVEVALTLNNYREDNSNVPTSIVLDPSAPAGSEQVNAPVGPTAEEIAAAEKAKADEEALAAEIAAEEAAKAEADKKAAAEAAKAQQNSKQRNDGKTSVQADDVKSK